MSNTLTEERLQEKLSSQDNIVNILYQRTHRGGRTEGAKELSPSVRIMAGVMAHLGKNIDVAKALHVSPQSVSLAKHAKTTDAGVGGSSSPKVDPELKNDLDKSKEEITQSAVEIIKQAFGLLPLKMGDAKARDLSGIAKDAAFVVEKLSEKVDNSGLKVIINVPREKEEGEFEVIQLTPSR